LIGRELDLPPKTGKVKLDLGERNQIEGKFGQGKTRYGLVLIKGKVARNLRFMGIDDHTCDESGKYGIRIALVIFCYVFWTDKR
jgi:hypothetical protein